MSNTSKSWSPEEADRILRALDSSGLSVAEFSRQHGIVAHRLYWARRRRLAKPAQEARQPEFAQLAVIDERKTPVELRLPSGISVLVTRDFDEVAFRRVLGLLSPC